MRVDEVTVVVEVLDVLVSVVVLVLVVLVLVVVELVPVVVEEDREKWHRWRMLSGDTAPPKVMPDSLLTLTDASLDVTVSKSSSDQPFSMTAMPAQANPDAFM